MYNQYQYHTSTLVCCIAVMLRSLCFLQKQFSLMEQSNESAVVQCCCPVLLMLLLLLIIWNPNVSQDFATSWFSVMLCYWGSESRSVVPRHWWGGRGWLRSVPLSEEETPVVTRAGNILHRPPSLSIITIIMFSLSSLCSILNTHRFLRQLFVINNKQTINGFINNFSL